MIGNSGFSERDWELAPRYKSPVSKPGVVILDFDHLGEIARREQSMGSFRKDALGRLASAPLYVDNLPAAFYQVDTSYPEMTTNVNTSRRETLVVMDGVLKVVFNDELGDDGSKFQSLADTLLPGQVLELEDRAVAFQAVGVVDPSSCLALALYRDGDIQVQPVLN